MEEAAPPLLIILICANNDAKQDELKMLTKEKPDLKLRAG